MIAAYRALAGLCSGVVFGSVALAIVVLPEAVTSPGSLSAGFAGLMTALSFTAGVAVQPFARRLRDALTGAVAGLACAAAGTAVAIAAVAGAFTGLTAIIAGLALWTAGYAARLRRPARQAEADIMISRQARSCNSVVGVGERHPVRHNLKHFQAERVYVPAPVPWPALLARPVRLAWRVRGTCHAFRSGPSCSIIKVVFRFSAKR